VDELGICFLSFDRARYGESDPNPKRSVNSEAMDIEQLADQQEIWIEILPDRSIHRRVFSMELPELHTTQATSTRLRQCQNVS